MAAKADAYSRIPPIAGLTFGKADPRCPATEFTVGDTDYVFDRYDDFAVGSQTSLYRTLDGSIIVKVHDGRTALSSSVWVEEATLRTLDGFGVAPRVVVPTYTGGIEPLCALRVFAMEFVGQSSIGQQYRSGVRFSAAEARRTAVRLITLLEGVHSAGLLHGDIHIENVVGADPESMMLVDFGRASAYINPDTGAHIPLTMKPVGPWNPILLSVNELEGLAVSRRDDLFRAAELLVFLIQSSSGLIEAEPDEPMADRKRNRFIMDIVPQGIRELYHYTLNMAFAEDPDYNAMRDMVANL